MAKKVVTQTTDEFGAEVAQLGLSDFFMKVLDRDDMGVECVSTGLPRLDNILHSTKLGLVCGRDVEIFSKDPEVGKTSLALQIGMHWQQLGKKIAIVDIEDTITESYLLELKYQLDPDPKSGIYPVYVAKGFNPDTGETLPAETILHNIGLISDHVDMVIIDSIGALAKRTDLEKEVGDSSAPGGIAKAMWEFFRKKTHVKATRVWINQALPMIGVFSPAGIKYKTSGGNAAQFFDTLKLELRLVEKLKKGDEDPYGMVIDVFTAKNKVSPQYRHVKLTYLFGEAFSPKWDLFQMGITNKIIEKSGAWFSYDGERIGQGELNSYEVFKNNDEMFNKLKAQLEKKD